MTLITPSEPSSILNETGAVKFFGHWPSLIFVAMMLSFCGQVKGAAGATCRRKKPAGAGLVAKRLRCVANQAIVAVKRGFHAVDLALLHRHRFIQRDGARAQRNRAGSGDDFQNGIGLNVGQRFSAV